MVDRWFGFSVQSAVLALVLGMPSLALAWHIEGQVVCDSNNNGVFDGDDLAPDGIKVCVTALTATPGAVSDFTTAGGTGFYYVTLPDHAEDYRVEVCSGAPAGSSVVSPTSGAYGEPPVPPISLNPGFKHATGINFILDNCSVSETPTPVETATPVATETGAPTPLVIETPTVTPTSAETATPIETVTPVPTATPVETGTAGTTGTPLETATPGETATPVVASATPVETGTPVGTATVTASPNGTATVAATATPGPTVTPTAAVASATPASTETATPVVTGTPTAAVASATPATATPVATATPAATNTPLPTATTTPPAGTASPIPGTPTPTATLTPSPGITPGDFFPNHFQCYEIDRSTINTIKGIPVEDRFGVTAIDVAGTGRVKRLCNPADKNGEDPTAPADPNHLVGYVISKRTPRLTYPDQIVTNQFGSTKVSLTRPILLMVPSAKSLVGPPAPLPQPGVDHFQCYGVSNATTRVDGVQVVDQFTSLTLDVKRPSRLCVAVDKRGEGVLVPDAALMCYEVRSSSGTPRFTGPPGPVYVDNQFGPDQILVTRPTELCVPSSVSDAPARRRGRR